MTYLELGISLVERLDDPWNEQYTLCRDLFTLGADVGRIIGHLKRSATMIEAVIRQGRSIEEKRPACRLKVEIFGVRDSGEAISLAKSFLRETGYKFPAHPNMRHFVLEFSRTWLLVRKFEALMFLPVMEDGTLIHRMQLLSSMVTHAQILGDKV